MPNRILLVEDDPLIIESLTELLTASGYSVDAADTQQRAIELAVPAESSNPSPSSSRRRATPWTPRTPSSAP